MGGGLLELCFGPEAFGVEFEGFGECFAGFGVFACFAEGDAAPEVSVGEFGIELEGFVEVGDCFVDAAAEGGGEIIVADAAGEPVFGRFGIEFNGLGDFVHGAATVFEAGQDVGGDDLTAEGAEDAVVFGVVGLGGDGFAGWFDACFGGSGGGAFVAFFHGDFGFETAGDSEVVVGLGGAAWLVGGSGELGELGGEGGGVLAVTGVFENTGAEGGQKQHGEHHLYSRRVKADS